MKFLPNVRHCVYWVWADIWAPYSSHNISKKFFIDHCQGWNEGSFVCETVWFFFVGEYSSVWLDICGVLSQIQWTFVRVILRKKYFGIIFQKFSCKPRLSSTKTCEISPYIALKKFTQVFSCVRHCVYWVEAEIWDPYSSHKIGKKFFIDHC